MKLVLGTDAHLEQMIMKKFLSANILWEKLFFKTMHLIE